MAQTFKFQTQLTFWRENEEHVTLEHLKCYIKMSAKEKNPANNREENTFHMGIACRFFNKHRFRKKLQLCSIAKKDFVNGYKVYQVVHWKINKFSQSRLFFNTEVAIYGSCSSPSYMWICLKF